MLDGSRVLIACGDGEAGLHIASAFALVQARVIGPVLVGEQALAEIDHLRPDALVVEPTGNGPGLIPLLERALREGIPTVICAEPGLLPEFRGRHPFLSVLQSPCRPLRLVGEVAVLLAA